MGTRVYHVITATGGGKAEETESRKYEGKAEKHDEKFEMSARTHHTEDGKSEVSFEGKMTLKDKDYYKYVEKYGHHFSRKLSEFLVKEFAKPETRISYDKVEEILKQSGEELDEGHTVADLYYVSNMIKNRHSTSTIKSDSHVVMLAVEYLNDPSKSEGETFCEWFDGLKRKNKEISWNNFM